MPSPLLRTLALAALAALAAPAQEATRYLLAPAVLQADPNPSRYAPDPAALARDFGAEFRHRVPGARPLSEQDPLTPGEPTLLVVPRLSAVRLSRDSVAGTLDRYEATLVGDVALIDPWSNARLFTATRMVIGVAELSRGQSQTLDADLRLAFQKAAGQWLSQCLDQLQRQAHPFTLQAAILPAQPGIKLKAGGLWPFGSLRGVARGRLVMGVHGKRARVKEVFERFALLEDASDPGRLLKAEENYRLLVLEADSKVERSEPRLALQWRGAAGEGPDPATRQGMAALGWLGLASNYLSKDGRFRLLPLAGEATGVAQQQWQALTEDLNRFSVAGQGATVSAAQADWALKAQDEPEFVVEVGLVDGYHGLSRAGDGALDQLFRVRWAMSWFERREDGTRLFRGCRFLADETTVRTKAGVRELDPGSIWFNLCRNTLIKLAEQTLPLIRTGSAASVLHRGQVQGSGAISWDRPPSPGRRLAWLRPQGEVRGADGKSLGRYLQPLGQVTLAEARPQPQDELQYSSSAEDKPEVALLLPDLPSDGWLLAPRWLQGLFAARLLKAAPLDLVLQDDPAQLPASKRLLRLKVDAPSCTTAEAKLNLAATWRLRLYEGGYDDQREPAFKLGLAHAVPFPLDPFALALRPQNPGQALFHFQDLALEELLTRAANKGLLTTLTKE